MKIDILAVGAHPDDVELSCGATLAKEVANGKKVGILDLTRGELGTRGSAEIRDNEIKSSRNIGRRISREFRTSRRFLKTIAISIGSNKNHSKIPAGNRVVQCH